MSCLDLKSEIFIEAYCSASFQEFHRLRVPSPLLFRACRSAEEGRDERSTQRMKGDDVEMIEKKRPTVVKILVLIVVIGSILPIVAGVMMMTGGAFEGLDGQVTIVERGRTSLVFWGGERDDEELFYPVFRTSYW